MEVRGCTTVQGNALGKCEAVHTWCFIPRIVSGVSSPQLQVDIAPTYPIEITRVVTHLRSVGSSPPSNLHRSWEFVWFAFRVSWCFMMFHASPVDLREISENTSRKGHASLIPPYSPVAFPLLPWKLRLKPQASGLRHCGCCWSSGNQPANRHENKRSMYINVHHLHTDHSWLYADC